MVKEKKVHTCRKHGTLCPRFPLAFLSLSSLCQIGSSKEGRTKVLPPPALQPLLRSDFALRSEAAGCSRAHLPPGTTSSWAGPFSQLLAEPFLTPFAFNNIGKKKNKHLIRDLKEASSATCGIEPLFIHIYL